MSLTANALNELNVITGPEGLFQEWLAGWFDGGPHVVGRQAAVEFPRASLAFGVGPVAQPLNGLEIRVVVLPRRTVVQEVAGSAKLAVCTVLVQFWCRAALNEFAQSQYTARRAAELLHALCNHPDARFPLAEKGVKHLSPQTPMNIPAGEHALVLLGVTAELAYTIPL